MSIAKTIFGDRRSMTQIGVDKYKTEDNQIVVIKIHEGDFTPKKLAEYVEFCEETYDKYEVLINLYVVMDPQGKITVKQMDIKSYADFTIKLACGKKDPCLIALETIGRRIADGIATQEDYESLKLLPLQCKKEERLFFRQKTLELLNMVE